ncbi:hypothetical protein TWF718_008423 [Orbilia javanica]|uniref:Uncharacterized protein n=1 Tax=Orbilia javanica TaxID=47235 RepID=A0AAN8RHB6_9PEZI
MPTAPAHSSSIGKDQSSDMKPANSKPAALSFKILEPGQQEIRPPLTPATEVDLQKSCAILVQSTRYSRSFKDAVNSTSATATTSQRRSSGTVPVVRSHGRTPSKSGSKTPVGRVVKSSAAGSRRNGSTVKYDRALMSSSNYVPPRRPAPEKVLPVARRVKMKKEDGGSEEEKEVAVFRGKREVESRHIERKPAEKEMKSSDGSSLDEAKNKKGVKKLVNVMTGYIRPHDVAPQTTTESQSSPASSEVSPSKEKPSPWETLQTKPSKRKNEVTFVEALPEQVPTKSGSDEEKKNTGLKRNISKRLGHAVKDYVKPPHIDRFTPEPLHSVSSASKEEQKKAEQKKHRVTKAMREYVKPSPLDAPSAMIEEKEPVQSAKTEKTVKSAKPLPIVEKPTSPTTKDLRKASPEPAPSKPAASNGHSHHNPFRLLHEYVKPSMTDPPVLRTNVPQASASLSPVLPSERRPLTPRGSQPSMPYVPPKIRPRGKTPTSDDDKASPDQTAPTSPSITTRQGPIFGGGYPVKQDVLTTTAAPRDEENRGPVSPGFFGRNPGGSGFRIHFSHFLHKQRGDGYDQLE